MSKPAGSPSCQPEDRRVTGDLELARHYGVTTKTVYEWRGKGMPATQVGRHWVYELDKTDEWVGAINTEGEDDGTKLAIELRRAKLRIEQAKATRLEREEEIAAGNVLPRDELELFATELIQEARDRLLRLARDFKKHQCKKCQAKSAELQKMIEGALDGLAKLGDGPPCDT